jgi:hypothetical protein
MIAWADSMRQLFLASEMMTAIKAGRSCPGKEAMGIIGKFLRIPEEAIFRQRLTDLMGRVTEISLKIHPIGFPVDMYLPYIHVVGSPKTKRRQFEINSGHGIR